MSMRNLLFLLLPAAILLSVFALPGSAALVGTSVTGSLTFAADPSNYFDPAYGFVPATGYLNASGTTVTISNSAVEFGFDDASSLISADFSDTQLTINDLIETAGPTNSFQTLFTDTAFAGQSLALVSDSFPLADYSVAGDVITLDYSGGNPTVGQTLTATFNLVSTPEPATAGTVFVCFLATLGVFLARKHRPASTLN